MNFAHLIETKKEQDFISAASRLKKKYAISHNRIKSFYR